MSNRVYKTGKAYKNISHIMYFNYNKKSYYVSTYIKLRKNSNTSNNKIELWKPWLVSDLFLNKFL